MENKNILVTGASGNIGYETIRGLWEIKSPHTIFAADYKPENAKKVLAGFEGLQYRKLDFADAGEPPAPAPVVVAPAPPLVAQPAPAPLVAPIVAPTTTLADPKLSVGAGLKKKKKKKDLSTFKP